MQIILLPPGSQAALKLANANLVTTTNKSAIVKNHTLDAETAKVGTTMEQPVRKRHRLDHLSEQEKLFRRKLKNRVAAQVARDKKKAKMDELESIVEELRKENEKLKEKNARLLQENARLRSQNGEIVISEAESVVVERMYPVESAVLINGPLPQEQGYIPPQPLNMLLQVMLILLSALGLQTPSKLMKLSARLALQSQTLTKQPQHRTNALLPQEAILVQTGLQPP